MQENHTPVETSQYHFVTHMQMNTLGTGKNTCSPSAFSPVFEIGVFCAAFVGLMVVLLHVKKVNALRLRL